MVNIWFKTREGFEKHGIGKYGAGICFYGKGEEPVKVKGEGEYICARLDDLSYFGIRSRYGGGHEDKFFPEADRVAEMAIRAVAEGKPIYFQEDTRGASCAAAILEFFTGGGMQVFNKSRCRRNDYGLNVEIYEKLYGTLCCLKLLMDDIDFDKLRTGRAAVNKQENISKIYDIMCEEYAALKGGEKEIKEEPETVNEAFKTAGGIFISVHDCMRCGEMNNEVFGFYSVTKDKVWHLYNGIIDAQILEEFLGKYAKEDIEYFAVIFWHENNDHGVKFIDSECGDSFTDEHLITYFDIIKEKYGVTEDDIYD